MTECASRRWRFLREVAMKFPGLSLSIFALLAGPALGQDEAREPAPDEVSYEETQELIDRIQARIDRMEKSRAEADTSMEFLTRQIEKAMAGKRR